MRREGKRETTSVEARSAGWAVGFEAYSGLEASEKRKASGDSAERETEPGRAGSAFCGLEKRARAEGKAGKGLHEVCLPSAG